MRTGDISYSFCLWSANLLISLTTWVQYLPEERQFTTITLLGKLWILILYFQFCLCTKDAARKVIYQLKFEESCVSRMLHCINNNVQLLTMELTIMSLFKVWQRYTAWAHTTHERITFVGLVRSNNIRYTGVSRSSRVTDNCRIIQSQLICRPNRLFALFILAIIAAIHWRTMVYEFSFIIIKPC